MRMLLAAFSMAILFFALIEILLAQPIPWWLYALVGVAFAAALLRRRPLWDQRKRLIVLALVWTVLATLYLVPWTTRRPFLRRLYSIRPGMTEGEVRRIMAGYMEGTGWEAPSSLRYSPARTIDDPISSPVATVGTSPSGELAINNALVFRHSNDGAFNADWGVVNFSRGRVVGVYFSPD